MKTEVRISHLEMNSPDEYRPRRSSRAGLLFSMVPKPTPSLNRYFYTAIGGDYHWHSRLKWTIADWMRWLDRPELETWILSVDGIPAGYCELEAQAEDKVEISYFGLLPEYVGEGLGAHLLSCAIERAWERGPGRVWVHTCSLDHPRALANYLDRGFKKFREEIQVKDLPAETVGPWEGSRGT